MESLIERNELKNMLCIFVTSVREDFYIVYKIWKVLIFLECLHMRKCIMSDILNCYFIIIYVFLNEFDKMLVFSRIWEGRGVFVC